MDIGRHRRKGIIEFVVIFVLALAASLFLFTCWGATSEASEIISLCIIGIGSGLVWVAFRGVANEMQCGILYVGYLLRCACMLVDIYGRSYITLLHSGPDAERFAQEAAALYDRTITGDISTKYPYVINWMYHIVGENHLCAQYANVILWVLSVGLLIRICNRFQVRNNIRMAIYAIWSFLPTGILLSGILLRESTEMFFGMWSFERFLCWMQDNKWKHCVQAFLCVIPAMILHSASVALWAAYVAVMMLWDFKKQKYRWQMKSSLVLFAGIVSMLAIRDTWIWKLLFGKLGSDFSLYGITHKRFYSAGSDYLTSMDCQSWLQFVPYTLIRMFYFLFSPLPMDARGIKDIAMFLADSLPLAVIICWALFNAHRKKEIRGYTYAALLGGSSFAGIFAWGVRNAGTALRHRYLAWSIFIIAFCACNGHTGKRKMEAEGACHIKS